MSITLYEIKREIAECVDTETGEIIDIEKLSQLVMDRETKIDNIISWYKELNSEVSAIESEVKSLTERRESKKNRMESLKRYLSEFLDGLKFESSRNAVTWRKSDEVNITDESRIPDRYKKEVTEVKISRADIKKAIKDGQSIDGAELVYKNNIQIK